jgi:P pilus assembly protein, chaperone PapD
VGKLIRVIKVRYCKAVFCLALTFWLICAVQVQAETTLGVSPLKLEYGLPPGGETVKTVTVNNPGTTPLQVTTEINDFKIDSRGVPVFSPPENGSFLAGNWLQVTPQEFSIKPGESKQVQIHVKAPKDAEPGGHYGAVLFMFGGPEAQEGQVKVGISGRIAVVNMITIPGTVKREGAVKQFSIPLLSSGYPVGINLSFNNTGSVHLPIGGAVRVKNWLGQQVISIPLPEGYVFPSAVKPIQLSMSSGSLFGFYRANLTLNEPAIANDTGSVTFIVFPWPIVLGVILVAFGLYKLGVRKGRRTE